MTHITKELNDAILQALYDTGHRFNSTWRQIILDIVEEFWGRHPSPEGDAREAGPRAQTSRAEPQLRRAAPRIGSMGSGLVAEDLRGFHFKDFGSRVPPYFGSGWSWGIHKPMTLELLATVELSDVNTPWADEDIVVGERWGKVGPKAAWFLEKIRELNFMGTEDHREFLYRAEQHQTDDDNWWWPRYFDEDIDLFVRFASQGFSGCLEGITWSVLIKYLSFIHEMSNWTMPLNHAWLMRTPGSVAPHRDCLDHWKRLMNGEVSGMGEGHVYECFNQEQGERLPGAWNRVADLPRREHVIPQGGSVNARQEGNKKEMIHEILSIIEQQVDEDKITEKKYKDLSELLMEFHKSIK